jgi:LAO/AO transport system kinase
VLQWRTPAEGERVVPVILTAANDAGSMAALSAEIDAHTAWLTPRVDAARMAHARALFHARALLHRRVAELANALPIAAGAPSVRQLYSELIRELAQDP